MHGYGVHIQKNEDGTVYGYSIKRGNSSYKSSKLGIGRNLVPSKIMNTWQKLHPQEGKINQLQAEAKQTRTATPTAISKPQTTPQPVMKLYSIGTDDNRTFAVSLSEAADNIIRQECSWRKPTHWLSWKRYSTRHFCCLPDIWMQPQVWRFQAVAVVLIQVAGDGTKTKMNLNGHAVVREWQTKCASAEKGFTDNFSTQYQKT